MTRTGGVDDRILEGSEQQRDHDEEEEFGDWKTVLEHDPRQTERTGKNRTRDDASPVSQLVQTLRQGEEDGRKTAERQLRKRDEFPKFAWTACSWATRRKGKHWRSGWQGSEKREPYIALWFRASRLDNGYVEGRWHGFVERVWSFWTSS